MRGVGVDFGTSNSAVACYDGERLEVLRLDAAAARPEVMPTALYMSCERQAEVGTGAIERYVRENAGRNIEPGREDVGAIEITVSEGDAGGPRGSDGSITTQIAVHAMTDRGLPGRLFRGLKRWLGEPSVEYLRVFGTDFRVVALLTPILEHMAHTAQGRSGEGAPYVGRPVRFEGRADDATERATCRLLEACGYAGLKDAVLYPEPVAVARSFLHTREAPSRGLVLAFDFGGGTLDLTLVRRVRDDFRVLATEGLGIGGDEIDRRVYRSLVFPELGKGCVVRNALETELETFDFEPFERRLLNWPLAYELNRPELRGYIHDCMRIGGDAERRLARLLSVVKGNLAYGVFQAIEAAKLALSERTEATIELPDVDLCVPITRAAFEALLEPVLDEVDACIAGLLKSARVSADDVDVVVRTGGSSQIPAVRGRLAAHFGDRVVEHGVFTSIAAGLALASWHGHAPPLD